MEKRKAKIFVSHYPPDLPMYKAIATISKDTQPHTRLFLFKVEHPYHFNVPLYKDSFDTIVTFPFIAYEKNIIEGVRQIVRFKRVLQKALRNLEKFSHIDVYIEHSAWLPANVMLFALGNLSRVRHIYRLTLGSYEIPGTRIDWGRTLFCYFYHLFINAYPVNAMKRIGGGFATFNYLRKIPGILVKMTSPALPRKEKYRRNEFVIPYPVLSPRNKKSNSPDMVIIFGDKGVIDDFPDYVATSDAKEILHTFFSALEKHYQDTRLYYKPHPGAPGDFLPGMNPSHYKLLPASVSAQAILQEYWPRVKAAYTFFSTSVAWSSFFAIPSYTLYKMIYNTAGVKRLDEAFGQPDIASPLLFALENIKDIGRIDNKKTSPQYIDKKHIPSFYKSILN